MRFQIELEKRLEAGEELTELTVDEILHKYRSTTDKFIVESFYLFKDSRKGRVFPVKRPRKGVREAVLEYRIVETAPDGSLSLAEITLHTGRTHQIRVQFASRKHPLYGDGKYGSRFKGDIALQSAGLQFVHPETGKPMAFSLPLPAAAPWKEFLE